MNVLPSVLVCDGCRVIREKGRVILRHYGSSKCTTSGAKR